MQGADPEKGTNDLLKKLKGQCSIGGQGRWGMDGGVRVVEMCKWRPEK